MCVQNLFDPLSTGRLGFLSRKVCTQTDLQLQPAKGIPGSWNKRCVQNGFWSRSIFPRKQERSKMLPVYFRRMVGQCFPGLINATWSVDINHLRASPCSSWILLLWKPFISSRQNMAHVIQPQGSSLDHFLVMIVLEEKNQHEKRHPKKNSCLWVASMNWWRLEVEARSRRPSPKLLRTAWCMVQTPMVTSRNKTWILLEVSCLSEFYWMFQQGTSTSKMELDPTDSYEIW